MQSLAEKKCRQAMYCTDNDADVTYINTAFQQMSRSQEILQIDSSP